MVSGYVTLVNHLLDHYLFHFHVFYHYHYLYYLKEYLYHPFEPVIRIRIRIKNDNCCTANFSIAYFKYLYLSKYSTSALSLPRKSCISSVDKIFFYRLQLAVLARIFFYRIDKTCRYTSSSHLLFCILY